MAQQCSKALEQFSEEILDTIATDMTTTMGKCAETLPESKSWQL